MAHDFHEISPPHELTMGLAFFLQQSGFSMAVLLFGKGLGALNLLIIPDGSYP